MVTPPPATDSVPVEKLTARELLRTAPDALLARMRAAWDSSWHRHTHAATLLGVSRREWYRLLADLRATGRDPTAPAPTKPQPGTEV